MCHPQRRERRARCLRVRASNTRPALPRGGPRSPDARRVRRTATRRPRAPSRLAGGTQLVTSVREGGLPPTAEQRGGGRQPLPRRRGQPNQPRRVAKASAPARRPAHERQRAAPRTPLNTEPHPLDAHPPSPATRSSEAAPIPRLSLSASTECPLDNTAHFSALPPQPTPPAGRPLAARCASHAPSWRRVPCWSPHRRPPPCRRRRTPACWG